MNSQKLGYEIIQEDEDIIICYKPAGIATQTKRLGQQDMETLLKNYRAMKGEAPYIGVIHRLDQPVEGIMVFAKSPKAAAHLSNQVQTRNIGKHYYAVAPVNQINGRSATLEDYLFFDKRNNTARVVAAKTPQAKFAKLSYEICKTKSLEEGELALYDILLHTGRHHQIRVQFSNMGCPLLGDSKYGNALPGQALALCSYRLEFIHPTTNKSIDISIEPKNSVFAWRKED